MITVRSPSYVSDILVRYTLSYHSRVDGDTFDISCTFYRRLPGGPRRVLVVYWQQSLQATLLRTRYNEQAVSGASHSLLGWRLFRPEPPSQCAYSHRTLG
jgi:hypothetical protein